MPVVHVPWALGLERQAPANMTASRTANTSTASTDLPDGEGGFYTLISRRHRCASMVIGLSYGCVAVSLRAVVDNEGPPAGLALNNERFNII